MGVLGPRAPPTLPSGGVAGQRWSHGTGCPPSAARAAVRASSPVPPFGVFLNSASLAGLRCRFNLF